MSIDVERAAKIAALNDEFRVTTERIVTTSGIHDRLPVAEKIGLLAAVREFDCFTENNDPYGEHDFGSLDWHGEKVFWKIDYYDAGLKGGQDPLSAACVRVLVIMFASEY